MKTQKNLFLTASTKPTALWSLWKLGLFGLLLPLMSCAPGFKGQEQKASPSPIDRSAPVDDNNLTPDATDYWSQYPGASVPFQPDNAQVLAEYVVTHPLNNPTDFRVYFDFQDQTGHGRWGGQVVIGYRDNGQIYTGRFTTFNPTGKTHNQISYKNWYKGLPNSEFNQWFTWQNKKVFHGFFQDAYGAVIVVFDGGLDEGDGQGLQMLSGSIWFKNFRVAPAPQFIGGDGEQCWFLLPPSPYECGTFKGGDGRIQTTSNLYPGDGYKRLGTFSGVPYQRAFRN
ncbi:MAG: hypothetical protein N2Z70_01005 [Bdellovibrionaceae bacterium]|jgi:hypothetical protein|nr:hypothetical protein [Pseudobdellovibrionaceae bacterium]